MTLAELRALALVRELIARPGGLIPSVDDRAAMLLVLDRLELVDARNERLAAALALWADFTPVLVAADPDRAEEARRRTALAYLDARRVPPSCAVVLAAPGSA